MQSSELTNLVGHTLAGRYHLGSLLGQGGMGTVYKATDSQMSGRIVAVKVLAPHLVSDDKQVTRFEQEARAANQLRHPNTISVLDFGRDPAGHIFMVIEFLTGEDLTAILRRGRMAIERSLYIIRQVCKSLAEAHAKGIVHRDLKPDNIFVCEIYGEKDFVKVIDFGIAKFLEDESANLTQAGKMFGTPRYLSPEQAQGKKLDARSDLYSLGVILFECLAGRPPFIAEEAIAVAIKHVQEEPPSMEEVAPDVHIPEAVDRLVFKLLNKKPDQRYQSAEEVVAAIDEAMLSLQGATRVGNYTPAAAMTPARPSTIPPPSEEATRAMESISDADEVDKTRAMSDLSSLSLPGGDEAATMALDTVGARVEEAAQATLALDAVQAQNLIKSKSAKSAKPAKPAPRRHDTASGPAIEASSNRTLIVLLILAVLAVGAVVAVGLTQQQDAAAVAVAAAAQPDPELERRRIEEAAAAAKAAAEEAAKAAIEAERERVAALARKKAAERQKVVISSTPPGAKIFLGELELGTTPYEKQIAAKDPNVVLILRLEGHEDAELTLQPATLVANKIPKVNAELKVKEAAKPKPVAKPRPKRNADPFGGID